jgi:hypothetical protein
MERTYKLPGGKTVTLREMTIGELEHILEQAAKADSFGAVQVAELRLRRTVSVVEYGGTRVGPDVSSGSLLAQMSAKEIALIDEALKSIHDVRPSEVEAFLASAGSEASP